MNLPFPSGLIVSCQALYGEPLHGADYMAKMAVAAQRGGAVAIRANGFTDIKAIQAAVKLPVIAIIKHQYSDSEVYITPTREEASILAGSGAEIISVDATNRPRPSNERLEDVLHLIHSNGKLAMADISTFEEGVAAEELGFDIVATTLSGYTEATKNRSLPDFELLSALTSKLTIPVFAEGHVSTPSELVQCFRLGAYAVVVGTAITRPQEITQKFVDAFLGWQEDRIRLESSETGM